MLIAAAIREVTTADQAGVAGGSSLKARSMAPGGTCTGSKAAVEGWRAMNPVVFNAGDDFAGGTFHGRKITA